MLHITTVILKLQGQGSYGISMGTIHIIPIPDTKGNLWYCAKYRGIPLGKTIELKLNVDSGINGFDMEATAHTKALYTTHIWAIGYAIQFPYLDHI